MNPPPTSPPTQPLPPIPGPSRFSLTQNDIENVLRLHFLSRSIPIRPTSPDISAILSTTPRPRRTRSVSRRRSRYDIEDDPDPIDPEMEAMLDRQLDGENTSDSDSDSSLDLKTPLSHLMLRHGHLSPNSKLLPKPDPRPISTASTSECCPHIPHLHVFHLF
jgi:hypothetical protein